MDVRPAAPLPSRSDHATRPAPARAERRRYRRGATRADLDSRPREALRIAGPDPRRGARRGAGDRVGAFGHDPRQLRGGRAPARDSRREGERLAEGTRAADRRRPGRREDPPARGPLHEAEHGPPRSTWEARLGAADRRSLPPPPALGAGALPQPADPRARAHVGSPRADDQGAPRRAPLPLAAPADRPAARRQG